MKKTVKENIAESLTFQSAFIVALEHLVENNIKYGQISKKKQLIEEALDFAGAQYSEVKGFEKELLKQIEEKKK